MPQAPAPTRTDILKSVLAGERTPDEAEALAQKLGYPVFATTAHVPDVSQMPWWTAPMVFAWIVWRDENIVAKHASTEWRSYHWEANGDGHRLVGSGEPPAFLIELVTGCQLASVDHGPIVEADPEATFYAAHTDERIVAFGRPRGRGDRIEIPFSDWADLQFCTDKEMQAAELWKVDRETGAFGIPFGVQYSDLRWRQSDVKSVWPFVAGTRDGGRSPRERVAAVAAIKEIYGTDSPPQSVHHKSLVHQVQELLKGRGEQASASTILRAAGRKK